MSNLEVPAGWEDLDFLFTTRVESCGGSCSLKFDETGTPQLIDNCAGTNCHCMGALTSVRPYSNPSSAVPWPCIAPAETIKILDAAVDRYLRTLRYARLLQRLTLLFGVSTVGLAAGMVWMWLSR